MKSTVQKFLVVILCAVALAACASASSNNFKVKPAKVNAALYPNSSAVEGAFNVLNEQVDGASIKETPAILAGKFRAYEIFFPLELLQGEWHSEKRLKWYASVVNPLIGNESIAQLIFPPKEEDQRVVCVNGRLHFVGWLIVDGEEADLVGAKVLGFSTQVSRGYDLSEKEVQILLKSEFRTNDSYRWQVVSENGVEVLSLQPADYVVPIINQWLRYTSQRGYVLSPWLYEELLEIAALNPAYSHSQKYEEYASKTITTDPIGLAGGLAWDVYRTATGPPKGWDLESDDPKERKKRERKLEKLMLRLAERDNIYCSP